MKTPALILCCLCPALAGLNSVSASVITNAPVKLLPLSWDPVPDAVSYELWSTADLTQPWQFYTNAPTTNAIVPMNLRQQFFKAISVNADGLNSFGNYQ